MASPKKLESKYTSLESADLDLEGNDSDTTACSDGFLSKKGSILNNGSKREKNYSRSRSAKIERSLTWLRWGSVISLQTVILVLLLVREKTGDMGAGETETGGDINGLYVPLSHTYKELVFEPTLYVPNMTTDANRMEVRHNWDMLMPLGSGSVSIPNWREYPLLGQPISDDPIREGPLFEASWTHALHCLYYTVDTYHQLLLHGRNGEENPYHATHCFEYLRTNILCSADMTLEGATSASAAEGRGQAHVCRNREEAIEWIEKRRVDDLQDIVGP